MLKKRGFLYVVRSALTEPPLYANQSRLSCELSDVIALSISLISSAVNGKNEALGLFMISDSERERLETASRTWMVECCKRVRASPYFFTAA